MVYDYKSVGEKEFFIHLLLNFLYTFIICTVIAVLLLLVGFGKLFENFVITYSIGFLTCCCAAFSIHFFRPEKKATFVHGLKFHNISEEQRGELQAVLSKPDFNKPVVPGNPSMRQGLGDLMEDLSQDLDNLGNKLGES